MKKIFLFAIVSFFAYAASAQSVINQALKSQYGNTEDTITNAVKYLTSTDLGVGGFSGYSVATDYVETSGTTAGTAKVQYSLDGSIYATLPTDSVYTAVDAATNSYIWSYSGKRAFRYIRLALTPSGTMNDKVHGRFTGIR